jgi:hypothetical protein
MCLEFVPVSFVCKPVPARFASRLSSLDDAGLDGPVFVLNCVQILLECDTVTPKRKI